MRKDILTKAIRMADRSKVNPACRCRSPSREQFRQEAGSPGLERKALHPITPSEMQRLKELRRHGQPVLRACCAPSSSTTSISNPMSKPAKKANNPIVAAGVAATRTTRTVPPRFRRGLCQRLRLLQVDPAFHGRPLKERHRHVEPGRDGGANQARVHLPGQTLQADPGARLHRERRRLAACRVSRV